MQAICVSQRSSRGGHASHLAFFLEDLVIVFKHYQEMLDGIFGTHAETILTGIERAGDPVTFVSIERDEQVFLQTIGRAAEIPDAAGVKIPLVYRPARRSEPASSGCAVRRC